MMIALLDRAKVKHAARFGADQIAEAIHIKAAGPGEVADREFHMAGAYDIERRIELRLADRHRGFYGGL